jgi:hypothetical protein
MDGCTITGVTNRMGTHRTQTIPAYTKHIDSFYYRAPAPTPDSCEVPSTTASQDSLYGELGKLVGAPRVRLPVIIPVKGGMPPPPGMTMIGLGRERSWVRDSRIRA